MSTFEPKQRVRAPRTLQILGRLVKEGQQGTILWKHQDMDRSWLYGVRWDVDSVLLPAREDEIELVQEGEPHVQ